MEAIQSFGGIAVGYWFYHLLTQPLKFKNKLPKIKIKALEFLPSLKIRLKNRIIHIHHWIFLSAIFVFLLTATTGFAQLLLFKSFCVGGIIQGFTIAIDLRSSSKINLRD